MITRCTFRWDGAVPCCDRPVRCDVVHRFARNAGAWFFARLARDTHRGSGQALRDQ
jgi:hypothetical protein